MSKAATSVLSVALVLGGAVRPAVAEPFRAYDCADGTQFVAAFYPSDPRRTHLQVDGKAVALIKRPTLSGSRYSGDGVVLAIPKIGDATLKVGKRPGTRCSLQ